MATDTSSGGGTWLQGGVGDTGTSVFQEPGGGLLVTSQSAGAQPGTPSVPVSAGGGGLGFSVHG